MNDALIETREEFSLIQIDDADILVVEQERIEILSEGIQGPAGPPGASGNSLPAIYFDYGDASPLTIYTPTVNQIISSVTLVVLIAFNGVAAKVSIGTAASPELLMDEDDSNLSSLSAYETDPEETILSGTPIKAFITPGGGATTGRCMVLIDYATA